MQAQTRTGSSSACRRRNNHLHNNSDARLSGRRAYFTSL